MQPRIIGISGNMGAGKTTLTRELARTLDSSFVAWDDFDEISSGPEDYVDWYQLGEDYQEWDYPILAQLIDSLKQGKAMPHPVLNTVIKPTQYIFFDAPLGRFHQQTGIYIDSWLHINVPLDVSLCRWVMRDFQSNEKTKEELLEELDYYLKQSRPLFVDEQYIKAADLVIDGMLETSQQTRLVKQFLKGKP